MQNEPNGAIAPYENVSSGNQPASLTLAAPLPLDRHPAAVYVARLAAGSRRTMLGSLAIVSALLGVPDPLRLAWANLRHQHTAAIRSALAERYAPATANKVLSALRGVLREAWELELMTAEEYQRAAAVKSIPGQRLPAGRALTPGEITAMLTVCANDTTPAGARDAALIAVLYGAGLRRAEVAALDLADFQGDMVVVREGKGNKSREVPLPPGAVDALADWLAVRGEVPGRLFLPIRKSGQIDQQPITTQAVYNVLAKRAAQAGVKALSPHDFRRTFVSDLLDAGADIATVQKLAGHSSVSTTTRYDRRDDAAKRKAVKLLHIPYQRRRMGL
jgi:integrase